MGIKSSSIQQCYNLEDLQKFYFDRAYFYTIFKNKESFSRAAMVNFIQLEFQIPQPQEFLNYLLFNIPVEINIYYFLQICKTASLYKYYRDAVEALYIFFGEKISTLCKYRFNNSYYGDELDDFRRYYQQQNENFNFKVDNFLIQQEDEDISDCELYSWQIKLLKNVNLGDVHDFDYNQRFMDVVNQQMFLNNQEICITTQKIDQGLTHTQIIFQKVPTNVIIQ